MDGREGRNRVTPHPMAIIWPCPLTPSSYAWAGKQIIVPSQVCSACQRPLSGWGGYWRWVRSEHRLEQRIWIRRGWCACCQHTQALLPSFLFAHRIDANVVIGSALEQAAAGSGTRPIAQRLELPHTTVRDWWRRVTATAPLLLAALLAYATSVDPAPVTLLMDGVAAVLEALAQACERTRQRLGTRLPDCWAFWSLISGGLALAPHTSPP
ncbi:MAG: hypothetical protein HW418_3182 [Anaerolineales bacterium]|nr:hypothetical protein [Anaerolineales bacterium]